MARTMVVVLVCLALATPAVLGAVLGGYGSWRRAPTPRMRTFLVRSGILWIGFIGAFLTVLLLTDRSWRNWIGMGYWSIWFVLARSTNREETFLVRAATEGPAKAPRS